MQEVCNAVETADIWIDADTNCVDYGDHHTEYGEVSHFECANNNSGKCEFVIPCNSDTDSLVEWLCEQEYNKP